MHFFKMPFNTKALHRNANTNSYFLFSNSYFKKIVILIFIIQGVLMSADIHKVKVNETDVPLIYEGEAYLPIASMQLVFDGAGHLNNTKDGIADLSAKLLNEGTKKDGSIGFATMLDGKAIDLYASVSRESLFIEVSSLKSEFPYAVQKLKELLSDPNYTQEAFAQVKRQKVGWLNQKRSDFDYISATALRAELFKGTALERPYDGTMESVESISLEDVKSFIQGHMGYNNAIVVAGGDLSLDEAKRYTQTLLEGLPNVAISKTETYKASEKCTTVYAYEQTQQAYIYFGAPFDYSVEAEDQYKAKIAEYILGSGGFGTRMMEEIRVKRGLTYGVYATLRRTKNASYLSGYLQTKLASQDEAKAIVQQVVDTFVDKGITQDELDKAKQFLVGSEPLRVETLSQRLGRAFGEYYYNRPVGYAKEQLENFKT